MADIIQNNRHAQSNNKKFSAALRVDLTPMVDLGFLLITFFVFTTTISQNNVLNLIMPKDSKDSTLIKKSGALVLLPAGSGKIYFYYGDNPNMRGPQDIKATRHILLEKKSRVLQKDFFVIIKPTPDADYSQIVQLLDEIKINDVTNYAFSDLDESETRMITEKNFKSNNFQN